jgi:hypothetical protein
MKNYFTYIPWHWKTVPFADNKYLWNLQNFEANLACL